MCCWCDGVPVLVRGCSARSSDGTHIDDSRASGLPHLWMMFVKHQTSGEQWLWYIKTSLLHIHSRFPPTYKSMMQHRKDKHNFFGQIMVRNLWVITQLMHIHLYCVLNIRSVYLFFNYKALVLSCVSLNFICTLAICTVRLRLFSGQVDILSYRVVFGRSLLMKITLAVAHLSGLWPGYLSEVMWECGSEMNHNNSVSIRRAAKPHVGGCVTWKGWLLII